MSVVVAGHLFNDDGQMLAYSNSVGVPTSSIRLAGWAHHQDSHPYVEDVGATTVAATSMSATVTRVGGVAYNSDGRMIVTTDAVAAADQFFGALRVRDDGALRINTTSVSTNDAFNGAWAFTSNGQARMKLS